MSVSGILNGISVATISLLLSESLSFPFPRSQGSIGSILWNIQDYYKKEESSLQEQQTQYRRFSCTDRRDGVYPDLTSRCSQYYRCSGGSVYLYACNKGQAMDLLYQKCRDADQVNCPLVPHSTPSCVNQTDGFYPDYREGCRMYYRCLNGTLTKGGDWCEEDSVWDTATGSCGSGTQVLCTLPTCWGLANGRYPLPGSKCSAYYECSNGVSTDILCPFGTIFDFMEKECVSTSTTVCYEGACEGKINGYHASKQASCQQYYQCFSGRLVGLKNCDEGQIFDGFGCISAANFTCWSDGGGTCEGRRNGLHKSVNYECRGFYLCHQEQFIRAFLCDDGFIFDGKRCIGDENHICISRPRIPDCANKFDGYHTVEESQCKLFFKCKGGKKISEHVCPENFVFNGNHCVDQALFQCQSKPAATDFKDTITVSLSRRARSFECQGLEDGYYVDQTSDCKSFYYCKNGFRIFSQSCPRDQVFSGTRCTDRKYYICPILVQSRTCIEYRNITYPNFSSGCSTYYKCVGDKRIAYACPQGHKHDGFSCRRGSHVLCPHETLCLNRSDGLHGDTSINSGGSFLCQNETLIKYNACKLQETYNGSYCVKAKKVDKWRFSLKDRRCLGRTDGYHSGLGNDCRSYHLCLRGKLRKILHCSKNTVFNGVSCVEKHKHDCPLLINSAQEAASSYYNRPREAVFHQKKAFGK